MTKDDGNNFEIELTRVGSRAFTFTKNWADSDNVLDMRGDFLRVALFREENGSDLEIAYIDIPTDNAVSTNTVTFTNGGNYYPAYDDQGTAYIYSLKEFICTGTPAGSETLCDNGAEPDVATTKREVKLTATADTTTTGYIVNVTEEATEHTPIDGQHDLNLASSGLATSWLQTESVTYRNQAAGQRQEVDFYVIWHDEAKYDERPDVFFRLYYQVGSDATFHPYTGSYTEKWESVEDGNSFIQKAVYTGLPIADSEGNVYTYYVTQTLNNACADYRTDYYTDAFFSGSNYNSAVLSEATKGVRLYNRTYTGDATESYRQLIVASSAVANAQTAGTLTFAKEGSFTVNTILDTIHMEGRKIWQGVPNGIGTEKLPHAKIYLFRSSNYEDTNKVPDNKNEYDTKSLAPFEGNNNGNKYVELNDAKSMYVFGTYKADGSVDTYTEFPKYDEFGSAYTYAVREIIFNIYENELPAEVMLPNYSIVTGDITNQYKHDEGTNRRNITIYKQWNVNRLVTSEKKVKATFRLYRTELPTDAYVTDDTDVSLLSSAAYAADLLNDPLTELELVDEKTIEEGTPSILWTNLPIFAPDGSIYGYYAVELISDMPGFQVSLYGAAQANAADPADRGANRPGVSTFLNANSTNVLISGTFAEGESYIGVAFSNVGISLRTDEREEENNLKTETFLNTYRQDGFLKITFDKEWKTLTSDAIDFASMVPGVSDLPETLDFEVYAVAQNQSGEKKNADKVNFAKGDDQDYSVTWEADPSNAKIWHYTITFHDPVPFYSTNGNLFTYYVKEVLNSDYAKANYRIVTASVSAKADTATGDNNATRILAMGTLSNEFKGQITVSKRWDDFSDDYGMREGSITFDVYYRAGHTGSWTLYKSGYTLSSANSWRVTLSKLPVTTDNSGSVGNNYEYRIVETFINPATGSPIPVPASAEDDAQNTTWTPNGSTTADPALFYTAVEAGNYKVYDPADVVFDTTNPESAVTTKSVKLVNQLDTGRAVVALKVVKNWADEDNYYNLRPSAITVTIQKSIDGGSTWSDLTTRTISSADVSATDGNVWEKTFTNLPKYYGTGGEQIYKYRAVETKLDGTTAVLDDANHDGTGGAYTIAHSFDTTLSDTSTYTTTINNTLRRRSTPITVYKKWNDEEIHTNAVTVTLLSRNYDTGTDAGTGTLKKISNKAGASLEKTLDGANSYTAVYADLPAYNKAGNRIGYYVQESVPAGYFAEYYLARDNGTYSQVTATTANTALDADTDTKVTIVNTPLISVSATKIWDDENDRFDRRDEVTVKLTRRTQAGAYEDVSLAEYKKTKAAATAVTATISATPYTAAFDLLPLYHLSTLAADGTLTVEKYEYRLEETAGPKSYSSTGDGTTSLNVSYGTMEEAANGNQSHTITNTLETRADIVVSKRWNDEETTHSAVQVALFSKNYEEGTTESGIVTDESTLVQLPFTGNQQTLTDGSLQVTYSGLPKYNNDGGIIIYYVKELTTGHFLTAYTSAPDAEPEATAVPADALPHTTAADTARDFHVDVINTPYVEAAEETHWVDANDRFGTRASSVYVKLQKSRDNGTTWSDVTWNEIRNNGEAETKIAAGNGTQKVLAEVTGTTWGVSLDQLPLYETYAAGSSAVKLQYRFAETDSTGNTQVPFGYTLEPGADTYVKENTGAETGYVYTFGTTRHTTVITNTLITKDVTVDKVWEDRLDRLGIRPAAVSIYVTEDTSVTHSTDSFNVRFLGGVDATHPYGASPLANTSVTRTVNADGSVWEYVFTGLPKYAYGADANVNAPVEIVYAATEDVTTADAQGFILGDYYEGETLRTGDTITITNSVKGNDGSLIIAKEDASTHPVDRFFTFRVTLRKPDASTQPFMGNYYVYDAGDMPATDNDLRLDAYEITSAYGRTTKHTTDGTIELKAGQYAVLTDINSRYTYIVTEDPSYDGYDVVRVEHVNHAVGINDTATASYTGATVTLNGNTANTVIEQDDTEGYFTATATGKIPSENAVNVADRTAKVIFTNKMSTVKDLKIENITAVATGADGNETHGGRVKIYKSGVVVSSSGGSSESFAYVNTETPYIKYAVTVQFEPDTANGYSFGDTLRIYWWEDGEDVTAEPTHFVDVSNYVYRNSDGEVVPYTGTVVNDGDGNVTVSPLSQETGSRSTPSTNPTPSNRGGSAGTADPDGSGNPEGNEEDEEAAEAARLEAQHLEALGNAWSELTLNSPFTNVTVMHGSVVLTLAGNAGAMPARTLIQVAFKAPEAPRGSGQSVNGSSEGGNASAPADESLPMEADPESGAVLSDLSEDKKARDIAQTGDGANALRYILLMAGALLAGGLYFLFRRKKKGSGEEE
ncbi:MAG: Cna B-type domain-containing protein [Lachnospiraceae bacterium]|nr:Cna B-type domain-containing protein [Lachnospiraceae bacterium]